jgi:hypothetical protein
MGGNERIDQESHQTVVSEVRCRQGSPDLHEAVVGIAHDPQIGDQIVPGKHPEMNIIGVSRLSALVGGQFRRRWQGLGVLELVGMGGDGIFARWADLDLLKAHGIFTMLCYGRDAMTRRKCDKVLQYVTANPGQTAAGITAGMPYLTVDDALRELHADGFVRKEGKPAMWFITDLGRMQDVGWTNAVDEQVLEALIRKRL